MLDLEDLLQPEDPNQLFLLKKQIGKGAFGKIFLGVCSQDQQKLYAVKIIRYEPDNADLLRKMRAEIEMMKKTQVCERFISYEGSFLETRKKGTKCLWIVMQFCDNGALANYLGNSGPFGEKYIASICKQILLALSFLSSQRIAHRDVKAANILWTSTGEVKLGDLGEAVELPEDGILSEDIAIAGTPYFMAPEVCSGEIYNEKCDIWSLGITLLELAEYKNPLFSLPPCIAIGQIVMGERIPGLMHPENFSQEFVDLVSKCLQYDPNSRPSAKELLNHPFVVNADDKELSYLATHQAQKMEIPEESISREKTKSKYSGYTSMATIAVMKDPETGQTLVDFIEEITDWKKENIVFLEDLCRVEKLEQVSANSSRKVNRMFSSKEEFNKRIKKYSVLIDLISKASSAAFGVVIASRTIDSVFHEKCFTGKDLVDWVYENIELQQRDDAIQLCRHMINAGFVVCINNKVIEHLDSESCAYRFKHDKIAEWTKPMSKPPQVPAMGRMESLSHMSKPVNLTERDWHMIMSGASVQSFREGEIIIEEGATNRCLYRVKKGSIKVEKLEADGAWKLLGSIETGEMFGEMSLLTKGKISATLRAASPITEIYAADVSFMKRLFKTEPGMHRRFYKATAKNLAQKLREFGDKKESSSSKSSMNQSEDKEVNSRDQSYVELFNLPSDEVVIQEYKCFTRGLFKELGNLYLSPRYVGFYAKVFGKQTKVLIPIREILNVEVTNKRALKIQTKKKKLQLYGLKDLKGTMTLIQSLIESHSSDPDSTPIEIHDDQTLSDFDWLILLKESKCKTFRKNEVIIQEGERATGICQIGSGKCLVKQKDKILGSMSSGEVFGEISFLEGIETTATVVAGEDETEVYIVESSTLKVLFMRQPALAGRFYQYLSTLLSNRLKEREEHLVQVVKTPR